MSLIHLSWGAALAASTLATTASAAPHVSVSPEKGLRSTVSPGDAAVIILSQDYDEGDAAVALGGYQRSVHFFEKIDIRDGMRFYPKKYLESYKQAHLKGAFVGCTKEEGLYNSQGTPVSICGVDVDGDKTFDHLSDPPFYTKINIKEKIPYRTEAYAIPIGKAHSSRLIYSGSNGNSVSFSYREFFDDMARPAFTENLDAPITTQFPQKIVVKGVVMEIYSVDGMGMNYSIIERK